MKRKWICYVLMMSACVSLAEEGVEGHMHRHKTSELIARFEEPGRAEWQKPDAVVARLGDLRGKSVADIGAGSGYFTFRVAATAKRVIAIDIDAEMLAHIDARKAGEAGGERVETRATTPEDPGLKPGEADVVLIVNTYHHIADRVNYLKRLRTGLADGGRLVVVDFHKKELPMGPPVRFKLTPEEVVQEFRDAGFSTVSVDQELLPYQYIVEAGK